MVASAEVVTTEAKMVGLGDLREVDQYKAEIPEPDTHDYEGLKASIEREGLLHPLVIDEGGAILDGYTRYRACRELGLTHVPVIVRVGLDEVEKLDYIDEVNLRRRHLTMEQKRQIIRQYLRRHPEASNRRVGEMAGVAKETAGKVRDEMVATGEISQFQQAHDPTKWREWEPETITVADHMDHVEIEVLIHYSAKSTKLRSRGSGVAALPYTRENERKTRKCGPFPIPSSILRDPNAARAAKGVVEAFGSALFQELRRTPIEGVAEPVDDDE